jgi:urease accessory protein
MTKQSLPRRLASFSLLVSGLALATPAFAHHVMGGKLPSTFGEGFLSGLGHPVIGLDHLAFIVAAGVIAGVAGLGLWMPVVFVAASILGVFVHMQEITIPGFEILIALSVIGIGLLLAGNWSRLGRGAWAAILAVAGLLHGYAFGESIVGAEPTPLYAYLAGLAIIQSVIAVGVAALVAREKWSETALAPRLAGAVVLGIGIAAFAGQVLPG